MIKGETPSRYSQRKCVFDNAFIKRKERDQKEYYQGEHEHSLIPAQRTGGKFHYFTEKQAPQG
jgi:hypothetical protein